MTNADREEFLERAAILEFEAGMTRRAAEAEALAMILDKRRAAPRAPAGERRPA